MSNFIKEARAFFYWLTVIIQYWIFLFRMNYRMKPISKDIITDILALLLMIFACIAMLMIGIEYV